METRRYPPRQAHRGQRPGRQVTGIEHHHVAAVALLSIDAHQHPAVVLRLRAGARHEHGFAVLVARRHLVPLPRAGLQVVAHHPAHLAIVGLMHCVGIAIGMAGAAIVDARQFDAGVIQLALADAAAGLVDHVAPQHPQRAVHEARAVTRQPQVFRIAHHVQHQRGVVGLVGVDHVLDETRRHLEPAHRPAMARDHAQARLPLVVPAQRHAVAARQHRKIVGHVQVQQDAVAGGDGHVVHHRRPGHLDQLVQQRPAVGIRHAIAQPGPLPVGAKAHQLAGRGINLGVRGHAARQAGMAAAGAQEVQPRRHRQRRAAFGQRQSFAGMAQHVDVGIGVGQVGGQRGRVFARPQAGAGPAVAVARGAAVAQGDGVQHRRLGPPGQHVVALETAAQGVGAVAHQRAVQLGRQRARHRQVGQVGFIGKRRGGAGVQVESGHALHPSGWRRTQFLPGLNYSSILPGFN
ncbi:Uncharacterised protein [Achromobacter xylosoxidans]|nr:Uncharacterised protein [Achromobacter xylosoxidans]